MAESGPAERRVAALGAPRALLLCLGLAFVVYWPSLADGFYNDDALFLNVCARVLERPARLFTEYPLGYFRPAWMSRATFWTSSITRSRLPLQILPICSSV